MAFIRGFRVFVAIDTQPGRMRSKYCVNPIISAMKANSKYCQDLNKQLDMYRAFRNSQAAAAVTRQLQLAVCPINS